MPTKSCTFMRLLVAPVIHYMSKNRSLSQDFGFVYISLNLLNAQSNVGALSVVRTAGFPNVLTNLFIKA